MDWSATVDEMSAAWRPLAADLVTVDTVWSGVVLAVAVVVLALLASALSVALLATDDEDEAPARTALEDEDDVAYGRRVLSSKYHTPRG